MEAEKDGKEDRQLLLTELFSYKLSVAQIWKRWKEVSEVF